MGGTEGKSYYHKEEGGGAEINSFSITWKSCSAHKEIRFGNHNKSSSKALVDHNLIVIQPFQPLNSEEEKTDNAKYRDQIFKKGLPLANCVSQNVRVGS